MYGMSRPCGLHSSFCKGREILFFCFKTLFLVCFLSFLDRKHENKWKDWQHVAASHFFIFKVAFSSWKSLWRSFIIQKTFFFFARHTFFKAKSPKKMFFLATRDDKHLPLNIFAINFHCSLWKTSILIWGILIRFLVIKLLNLEENRDLQHASAKKC